LPAELAVDSDSTSDVADGDDVDVVDAGGGEAGHGEAAGDAPAAPVAGAAVEEVEEEDVLPLPLAIIYAILASPLVIAMELAVALAAQFAGAPRVSAVSIVALAASTWRPIADLALPAIAIAGWLVVALLGGNWMSSPGTALFMAVPTAIAAGFLAAGALLIFGDGNVYLKTLRVDRLAWASGAVAVESCRRRRKKKRAAAAKRRVVLEPGVRVAAEPQPGTNVAAAPLDTLRGILKSPDVQRGRLAEPPIVCFAAPPNANAVQQHTVSLGFGSPGGGARCQEEAVSRHRALARC
jgi:hypothetical protein